MKKQIAIIVLIFLFVSCSKGVYLSGGRYRPKHPKFSVLKSGFRGNALLNYKYLYMSTKRFVNYDGNKLINCTGFYPDGKMILVGTNEKSLIELNRHASFNDAVWIGYYTTNGDRIMTQYFDWGDGGQYETREGIIKKDTVIFFEVIHDLFKKEVRADTLVKSSYALKPE